jgi:hypothetical protein
MDSEPSTKMPAPPPVTMLAVTMRTPIAHTRDRSGLEEVSTCVTRVMHLGSSPVGYVEKGRFKIKDQGWQSWAHPVVCGGKLYIRNQATLTAYEISAGR